MSGLAQRRDKTSASERARLASMVRIAASSGDFSPKLAKAVLQATDAEVSVMADLVERGLSVPALVNVLQGAHLLIGDDSLYEQWIFPHSRKRLSSHHRNVDKEATPDYGIDGPLVRESLHGKAQMGTWMQLERTKATFQWGKMPSWHDVLHIRDFVVYRVTGKNVGPWGLSANVDTRPIFLRPPMAVPSDGTAVGLGAFVARRLRFTETDSQDALWSDLLTPEVEPIGPVGDLFSPPDPPDPAELLPSAPFQDDLGPGLFGSLQLVQTRVALPRDVVAALDTVERGATLAEPITQCEPITIDIGRRSLRVPASPLPAAVPVFVGLEVDR